MKKHRFHGCALALFAAILTVASLGAAEDSLYHYVPSVGRVPLTPATDRILVKFRSGVKKEARRQVAAAESALDASRDLRRLIWNPRGGTFYAPLKSGARSTDVSATLNRVKTSADVEYATPVLTSGPGREAVILDEFSVSFRPGTSRKDIEAFLRDHHVEVRSVHRLGSVGVTYFLRVTAASGMNAIEMGNYIYERGNLDAIGASPNFYFLHPIIASFPEGEGSAPDDEYYDDGWEAELDWDDFQTGQFYLKRHHVDEAWKISTGSPNIVVAVVDTGVDLDYTSVLSGNLEGEEEGCFFNGHEDLNLHQWLNTNDPVDGYDNDDEGEIEGGYVDDYCGWSFGGHFANRCVCPEGEGQGEGLGEGEFLECYQGPCNLPDDDGPSGHGTASAGIVAAVSNNGIGVAGIAGGDGTAGTGCLIMPVKLMGCDNKEPVSCVDFDSSPVPASMEILGKGIEYAARNIRDRFRCVCVYLCAVFIGVSAHTGSPSSAASKPPARVRLGSMAS